MPTAFELTRKEWGAYIKSARRLPEPPALTPEEIQQREQLLARIQKAADQLKSRYSVRLPTVIGPCKIQLST